MALYSDRVYCFEHLQQLNQQLDKDIDNTIVGDFVRNDIRNQLAFMELDNYNRTGTFLYVHPLTKRKQLTNELDAIRKAAPERFMNELINADKSIARYKSRLNNNKHTDEERERFLQLIKDYEEKLYIMRTLIQQ